jgi:electron transfer flavoprotein alpha subunit
MGNHSGVLIYGEMGEGKLAAITLELLGIGRELADALGEQLSMVLIEKNASEYGQEAIFHGADQVYAVEDAPSEGYEGASYTAILEKICRETVQPAIFLIGQTLTGRDLAPRLSFRLDTGLVMDCVWLGIDAESRRLKGKRPVAGGNVLATYSVKSHMPQLATVRRKAMTPLERDDSRKGEILQTPAGFEESAVRARLIKRVKEESAGPDLETADVIVSGGRGIDTPEDFETYITKGLAKVLGAAVGGTRAAVDFGLISEQHQVGLTGKIVGPNLYFAVALSGATQHITGCSGSKYIVAINRDEKAQIFNFARFGIVGDYTKVLPPLVEKLKEVMSG